MESICDFLADAEQFESGEPKPTEEAVSRAIQLVSAVEPHLEALPPVYVIPFWGEVQPLWYPDGRMLQLNTYSDPKLYWLGDAPGLGRLKSVPATNEAVAEHLRWLAESTQSSGSQT